jgi:Uma2 family endonuclease
MIAVEKPHFLTVEEYLEGEQLSDVRHEYIGGVVYVMAGASDEHNGICLNFASALLAHLRGKSCRVFMADSKARLRADADDIFYYPDLMVACDPRDTSRFFKQYPRVLVEVLSESTERIDRREKFLSYTQIETLEEYVLVAQDKMEITLFRRANQWQAGILNAATRVLSLASIDFSIPLQAIYEGVRLPSRS